MTIFVKKWEEMEIALKNKKREELRITNPPKHLYDFVHRLARDDKRSIPKQLEFIIDEYYKLLDKKNTKSK
jgi:hypothetical protein